MWLCYLVGWFISIATTAKPVVFFIYSFSISDMDSKSCTTYARYLDVIVEAEWAVKMDQTNIKLLHQINSNLNRLKT